jgi:hypothetical protein
LAIWLSLFFCFGVCFATFASLLELLVALRCREIARQFHGDKYLFRAIATRYDKLARNFLAGVQLAAVTILLN